MYKKQENSNQAMVRATSSTVIGSSTQLRPDTLAIYYRNFNAGMLTVYKTGLILSFYTCRRLCFCMLGKKTKAL